MQYTELDLKIRDFTKAGGKARWDTRDSSNFVYFSLSVPYFQDDASKAVKEVWKETTNELGMTFHRNYCYFSDYAFGVKEDLFNNRYAQHHLITAIELLTQWQKLAKGFNPKRNAAALSKAFGVAVKVDEFGSSKRAPEFFIAGDSLWPPHVLKASHLELAINQFSKNAKIGITTKVRSGNEVGLYFFPLHTYKDVLTAVRKAPKGSLDLKTLLPAPKVGG